jgi:hypothetical protein
VQTEPHGSISRLRKNWAEAGLTVITLEIAYLLGNWEIVYSSQPDDRETSISQFVTLLTNFGSVV